MYNCFLCCILACVFLRWVTLTKSINYSRNFPDLGSLKIERKNGHFGGHHNDP